MSETITATPPIDYIPAQPEYIVRPDGEGSSGGPNDPQPPQEENALQPEQSLSPLTQDILEELQMNLPDDLLTGTGSNARISDFMRENLTVDYFHALLERAGSPENLQDIIKELRANRTYFINESNGNIDEAGRRLAQVVDRFASSLQMRLSHYSVGHTVPAPLYQEERQKLIEQEQSSLTTLQEATVSPEERAEEPVRREEAEPAERPPTPPDLLIETRQPEEVQRADLYGWGQERLAAFDRFFYQEPAFREGAGSLPDDIKTMIVAHIASHKEQLEEAQKRIQQRWYQKLSKMFDQQQRQRDYQATRYTDHLLMFYPTIDANKAKLLSHQLVELFPDNTFEKIDDATVYGYIRALEIADNEPMLLQPDIQAKQRRDRYRQARRRVILGGAALVAEAAFGFPTTRTLLHKFLSEQSAGVPEPVVTGPQPDPDLAEQERKAAELKRQREEAARQAEQQRLEQEAKMKKQREREQELAHEAEAQRQAEVQRQQQMAEEKARKEQKETLLSLIQKVQGRGYVLAGEQGNFTGDFQPIDDKTELVRQYTEDELHMLAQIQTEFTKKYQECDRHMACTFEPGKQLAIEVADYDFTKAVYQKETDDTKGQITDSIPIVPEQPLKLEISAVEVEGKMVKLRLENTYVGDGKVGPDGKSGAIFVSLTMQEALNTIQQAKKGTSVAYFAVGSEAYLTNAGNAMKLISESVKDTPGTFDAIQATKLNLPASHDAQATDLYDVGYIDGQAIGTAAVAGGGCGGLTPSWNEILRCLDAAGVDYTIEEHQNHSTGGYMPGIATPSSHKYPVNKWRDATMFYVEGGSKVNGVIHYQGNLSMNFQQIFRKEGYRIRKKDNARIGAGFFVASANVTNSL